MLHTKTNKSRKSIVHKQLSKAAIAYPFPRPITGPLNGKSEAFKLYERMCAARECLDKRIYNKKNTK